MGARTMRHNRLEALASRVARLNPSVGEIGAGMLASLVEEARELVGDPGTGGDAAVPAEDTVRKEYDRCLHLIQHPEESEPLFDVSGLESISRYYAFRAEGLGFAIDKLSIK